MQGGQTLKNSAGFKHFAQFFSMLVVGVSLGPTTINYAPGGTSGQISVSHYPYQKSEKNIYLSGML